MNRQNERVTSLLETIRLRYQEILGEKLTGIYIHGSLAFGCFRWECSDLDFLVVVSQLPSQEEKVQLIRVLLELDGQAPPKGFEMSVVCEADCRPFVYPTPFCLHYSNSHREQCKTDLDTYCRTMQGLDRDLGAHGIVIWTVGQVLCGKPVREVFGPVDAADYLDSIRYDVAEAETEILENPVYLILNLCRVAAYVRESLVLSKEGGGRWGMERLPQEWRDLVARAYRAYTLGEAFEAQPEELVGFARMMRGEI